MKSLVFEITQQINEAIKPLGLKIKGVHKTIQYPKDLELSLSLPDHLALGEWYKLKKQ